MLDLIPIQYRIFGGLAILIALFLSGYYEGKKQSDNAHQLALDVAVQAKLVAEQKAALITTQTVEKVVYQDKIITKQGTQVTKYIDHYVTQIDQNCTLSKEAVDALNQAAQEPK